MKSKVLAYEGTAHTVTYDVVRCIHAAECVKGLPEVFNPERKPWVEADAAGSEALASVIAKCPTGALKLQDASGSVQGTNETEATVRIDPDGPLFVAGPAVIVDSDGETVVLEDTRIALCRCGASANKPLCDGNHSKAGFADAGGFQEVKVKADPSMQDAGLQVVLAQNGPLLLRGHFVLEGADASVEGTGCALCRCGDSANKPFCDGAHKANGFVGS